MPACCFVVGYRRLEQLIFDFEHGFHEWIFGRVYIRCRGNE